MRLINQMFFLGLFILGLVLVNLFVFFICLLLQLQATSMRFIKFNLFLLLSFFDFDSNFMNFVLVFSKEKVLQQEVVEQVVELRAIFKDQINHFVF